MYNRRNFLDKSNKTNGQIKENPNQIIPIPDFGAGAGNIYRINDIPIRRYAGIIDINNFFSSFFILIFYFLIKSL